MVSGREEARLIYLGLLSRVHVDGRALVIDIGGGSTEVAVGDAAGADTVESVSLGAIRLATEGPRPDAEGRYTAEDYETLKHRVRIKSQHTLRDVGRPDAAAYATSGTAVNLAARGGAHPAPARAGPRRAAHPQGPARAGEAPARAHAPPSGAPSPASRRRAPTSSSPARRSSRP